jgi:hypothetical protein
VRNVRGGVPATLHCGLVRYADTSRPKMAPGMCKTQYNDLKIDQSVRVVYHSKKHQRKTTRPLCLNRNPDHRRIAASRGIGTAALIMVGRSRCSAAQSVVGLFSCEHKVICDSCSSSNFEKEIANRIKHTKSWCSKGIPLLVLRSQCRYHLSPTIRPSN